MTGAPQTRADIEALIIRLRQGCEFSPGTKTCSQARWQAADALEQLLARPELEEWRSLKQ